MDAGRTCVHGSSEPQTNQDMIYIEDIFLTRRLSIMKKFASKMFQAVKFASSLVVVAALAATAQAQFGFDVDADTNIVVSNQGATNPVSVAGIEARSAAGLLTFGDKGAFDLALSSTNEYVALASLAGVEIDGSLTIDTKYSGDAGGGDLTVGVSPLGASAPVSAAFAGGGGDVVTPEPTSGLLAAFGLLGLLGFRRRR